ncbi:MAG: hypothetical protein ACRD38_11740 [Nitrososphaerales archaeon]
MEKEKLIGMMLQAGEIISIQSTGCSHMHSFQVVSIDGVCVTDRTECKLLTETETLLWKKVPYTEIIETLEKVLLEEIFWITRESWDLYKLYRTYYILKALIEISNTPLSVDFCPIVFTPNTENWKKLVSKLDTRINESTEELKTVINGSLDEDKIRGAYIYLNLLREIRALFIQHQQEFHS